MFSLGTGAAIKLDVDISSEFELLPGATIKIDQSMDDINDLGHASHSATPIPTDNREKSSEAVMAEESFFDELAASNSESSNRDREAEHADIPEGAVLSPEETAALAEMSRLKTALASASSYGAGVNAKGKPARRRSDSARPSDILPEAWADMGPVLRKSVEIEFGAKRSLLRRQIAELKAKHSDLDFENLVRITSTGAVSIIVRPSCSDGWSWYDNEAQPAGNDAAHKPMSYLSSSPHVSEQPREQASKHTCTDRRATNSGAPGVSQRWAAMVPTPIDELSEEQVLLLKTVQAEDIFLSGGKGIRESTTFLT